MRQKDTVTQSRAARPPRGLLASSSSRNSESLFISVVPPVVSPFQASRTSISAVTAARTWMLRCFHETIGGSTEARGTPGEGGIFRASVLGCAAASSPAACLFGEGLERCQCPVIPGANPSTHRFHPPASPDPLSAPVKAGTGDFAFQTRVGCSACFNFYTPAAPTAARSVMPCMNANHIQQSRLSRC